MDGVVADMVSGVASLYGMSVEKLYEGWPPNVFKISGALGVSEDDMWRKVDTLGPSFWTCLPRYPWARDLYLYCLLIAPTAFLTTPTENPASLAGKLEWLLAFTGDRKFREYGMMRNKYECASPGRVLIDDKEPNCLDFAHAGGSAILFPRRWNRLHEISDNPMDYVLQELERLRT
jgi:hypothetical protein